MVLFEKELENIKEQNPDEIYLDYKNLKKHLKNNEVDEFDIKLENELNKINELYYNKMEVLTCSIEEVDSLRHFVIFNTIAVIKIIKKRNKMEIEANIDTKELLEVQDFYKCTELKDKISEMSIDELSNFQKTFHLIQLMDKHKFIDDYNLLPCNQGDYLINKLGDNSLNEIVNNEEKSLTWTQTILFWSCFLISLYMFIFGLGMMGDAFKALSGKSIGSLFSIITNPVAGLMIGIIVTVALQSSSTTTSIIVSMVGSNILKVRTAIPIIMGANIGTSITNTIVSHGNFRDKEVLKRAFAGATIHDIFNLLTVLVLLPLEVVSSMLYYLSDVITSGMVGVDGIKFTSPIKVIVNPLINLFIKIDKDVIKGVAQGCISCIPDGNLTIADRYCYDYKIKNCTTHTAWSDKYENGNIIKSGILKEVAEPGGGIIALVMSLIILCISLYAIVKSLNKLVMNGGKNSCVYKLIMKALNCHPIVAIGVGMLLTISVQSSSIITSALTPLVGVSLISLEQMLPLTLGANIGTTCTAFLAALVSSSKYAIQVAVCHLFFNIIGILIWFPLPFMRKISLISAKRLGMLISKYYWFGVFYILFTFLFLPTLLLGVSFLFDVNLVGLIFGVILILAILVLTLLMFFKFEIIVEKLQKWFLKKNNDQDSNSDTNTERDDTNTESGIEIVEVKNDIDV